MNENKEKDEKKDETEDKSTMYAISRKIIDLVKEIYKKDDEELLGEGSNIVKKLIKYGIILSPLTLLPFNLGLGVIISALTWYFDSFLDAEYTEKQKDNLLLKIEGEIEIVKDRINIAKEKNNLKEKENLIKLRNTLISKADKLKRLGAKSGLSGSKNDDD